MKFLDSLPNQEGFEFIGVDKDGVELVCVVYKNVLGCFGVCEKENKQPCFMRLVGWKRLIQPKTYKHLTKKLSRKCPHRQRTLDDSLGIYRA